MIDKVLKILVLCFLFAKSTSLEIAEDGGTEDPTPAPAHREERPHMFVSGVYSERLPSPIFYDTYVPIIFQYELPEWNKSEVTFNNWYHCESELLPYKSCAVMFHLNKAIANLHIDFESLQPVQDEVSHTEHYETLYGESSFCDRIQRHFSGIFTQKPELDGYTKMLARCHCSSGSATTGEERLHHIETVKDFNYEITLPYNRIEMNYYESFYKPINASSEILATAVLANSRSNIQATLLGTYYAEKYRWVHALQDCQQQLLPHSLISLKKLNDTLAQLASKPQFASNFEFAISLDLMSKYYSLPLTDCTYTNDSLVIRILFPVRFKSAVAGQAALQLLRLKSVPFRYDNQLCSVKAAGSNFLFDARRKLAFVPENECTPNFLCQMPTVYDVNSCATALLAENVTQTQEQCKFECDKYTSESLEDEILVSRVAPDKYVLSGRATVNGTIIAGCGNGGKPVIMQFTKSQAQSGAAELTLPCGCQFVLVTTGRRYFADQPCKNGSISLVHIEPWHLVDVKNSSEPSKVDPELVADYTHARKRDQPETEQEQEHESTSLTLIWVVFLLVTLLLLTLQVYVLYKLRILSRSSCYHTQIDGLTSASSASTLEPKTANTTIDNLLYYKVTGSRSSNGDADVDAEPEVCLLRNT